MINDSHFATASIDPSTGDLIELFPDQMREDIERTLAGAETAFSHWRRDRVESRSAVLLQMGKTLRANAQRYASAITREMGKPIGEALAEVEKCARQCDWYAENGSQLLADLPLNVETGTAYISHLPLGVILGVMPWNFPFWQVLRAAVPIILSGNCFILKHARNVTRCALNIQAAWLESGLPEGVFSILNIPDQQVGDVIADSRIAAVTVTAGTRAGSVVGGSASAHLKKTVLELGGSDAFIVLRGADLKRAAAATVKSRFQNNGQVCIAAKRFLLEEKIADEFTARFLDGVSALKMGDPMESATQLGPMARADLRTELHKQIEASRTLGADLIMGGAPVEGRGFYYEPTVLTRVKPGMPAFDEETFGPCAALTVVRDAEEAIALANQSQYGLSGSLWTEDYGLAREMARRFETGGVFINGFSASDPRVPIGGVKRS